MQPHRDGRPAVSRDRPGSCSTVTRSSGGDAPHELRIDNRAVRRLQLVPGEQRRCFFARARGYPATRVTFEDGTFDGDGAGVPPAAPPHRVRLPVNIHHWDDISFLLAVRGVPGHLTPVRAFRRRNTHSRPHALRSVSATRMLVGEHRRQQADGVASAPRRLVRRGDRPQPIAFVPKSSTSRSRS
jgi:hypothetical protein